MDIFSRGWCCSDCLFLFANGETPPELDEEATAAWLAEIDRKAEGLTICLGGEHDEDCPNMTDGQWTGETDCSCETQEFSWSSCDACGSHLGGSRHAVTYFEKGN